MISNRELKGQIEQITEQQQSLTDELQQIKDLLQQNQNQNQSQGQTQNQGVQGTGSGGSRQQNGGGSSSLSEIAKDFLKLKDMTSNLESKMQAYITQNSKNQPLSDEDAINLVLSMMNGMIDWSMDLVAKQSNAYGQSDMNQSDPTSQSNQLQ